jgi:hypothetical protein
MPNDISSVFPSALLTSLGESWLKAGYALVIHAMAYVGLSPKNEEVKKS